jgi:hypothetical protein
VPTPKSWQSNRTLAGRTGKQAADTPRLLAPTGYRTSGDYTNFSPKAMKDEPEAIGRVEVVRMADEASLVSEEKREIRRWQRKQPKRLRSARRTLTNALNEDDVATQTLHNRKQKLRSAKYRLEKTLITKHPKADPLERELHSEPTYGVGWPD